eukprot:4491391-Karenia_brevis.AAC.1
MYKISFYEILNVDPGAHKRLIASKYRKLAALVHPDKGGDVMHFLVVKHVYDILTNDTSRAAYDINSEHFRNEMPRAKAPDTTQAPGPDDGA